MEIHILNSKVISAIKQVLNRTDFCECIICNDSEMILKNDDFERVASVTIDTYSIWFDHNTIYYSFKLGSTFVTATAETNNTNVKIENYA